jgi:hypothetical protein
MDLTLPLMGVLGLIGYNVNKQINTRDYTEKRTKISEAEKPNTNSIYSSKDFNRFYEEEKRTYEKIRENNSIVTFNSKSDALASSKLKKIDIKQISEPNLNDYKGQNVFPGGDKIFNGPMFSAEKYFIQPESSTEFSPVENFENISMSGEKSDFSHQNMVPFFGGRLKNANTVNTLGRYTGTDNNTPKKEVESTQNGPVNNVFGNVLFTDVIQQDRFVSSNYHTSLTPFEQVRVQPIPSEYNRGQAKTLEELRTVNPKTVLEGRSNKGKNIDKRAILGEVPSTRFETTYELGNSRQFTTTGEENGTYYQDTFRNVKESKKNITSETSFNKNAGVDYRRGNSLRATKTEDGINTVVQDDKRGLWTGDWIRSRKTVSSSTSKDIPTTGNLNLRTQQRESGNRQNIGNASTKVPVQGVRNTEGLKTTNKELSLYSYKGGSNGNNIKKPDDRSAWYKNETKTKKSMEYTPGGKKANSPGVGRKDVHFETKDRASPTNYIGSSSVFIEPGTNSLNLGNITKTKFTGGENDYSERLTQKFQNKSLDRPLSKLSNKRT